MLNVDSKNNAILVPLDNDLVIFNIAVIKNVSKHEEGKYISIRFNFHVN